MWALCCSILPSCLSPLWSSLAVSSSLHMWEFNLASRGLMRWRRGRKDGVQWSSPQINSTQTWMEMDTGDSRGRLGQNGWERRLEWTKVRNDVEPKSLWGRDVKKPEKDWSKCCKAMQWDTWSLQPWESGRLIIYSSPGWWSALK